MPSAMPAIRPRRSGRSCITTAPNPPTNAATSIGRDRVSGTIITISAIVVMNSSDQSDGIERAPNAPMAPKNCQIAQPHSDGAM